MEKCPNCGGSIVLWKDVYDRFEHFYECENCKKGFWMRNDCELTSEENKIIDGYINGTNRRN